jgi:hypothetical protein
MENPNSQTEFLGSGTPLWGGESSESGLYFIFQTILLVWYSITTHIEYIGRHYTISRQENMGCGEFDQEKRCVKNDFYQGLDREFWQGSSALWENFWRFFFSLSEWHGPQMGMIPGLKMPVIISDNSVHGIHTYNISLPMDCKLWPNVTIL